MSLFFSSKLSIKNKATTATTNFPTTAEGTRSTFFAYLARLALTAKPKAVIKPNTNNVIKQSYANWKEIVDKHFVKNQE